MQIPSATFRSASPTFEEGQLFAHYLDQAAEGFFRFMLGPRAVDIIATVFTQPCHDLSYQYVTFVELDAVIVGMVSGYTAAQHQLSSGRILEKAAGRHNIRFIIISALFSPLLRIIDTIAEGYSSQHSVVKNDTAWKAGHKVTPWRYPDRPLMPPAKNIPGPA